MYLRYHIRYEIHLYIGREEAREEIDERARREARERIGVAHIHINLLVYSVSKINYTHFGII